MQNVLVLLKQGLQLVEVAVHHRLPRFSLGAGADRTAVLLVVLIGKPQQQLDVPLAGLIEEFLHAGDRGGGQRGCVGIPAQIKVRLGQLGGVLQVKVALVAQIVNGVGLTVRRGAVNRQTGFQPQAAIGIFQQPLVDSSVAGLQRPLLDV